MRRFDFRLCAALSLLGVTLLGLSNCSVKQGGTQGGNPNLAFVSIEISPYSNGSVSSVRLCPSAIHLQPASGDRTTITLSPADVATGEFPVSLASAMVQQQQYDSVQVDLSSQCTSGKSTEIINKNGTYSTSTAHTLSFSSAVDVDGSSNVIRLDAQPIVDSLASVASTADLQTVVSSVNGTAALGTTPTPSAPKLVQVKSRAANCCSQTTISGTFGHPVTAGNTLIACAAMDVLGSGPAISDNNGNTWVKEAEVSYAPDHTKGTCWRASNAMPGSTTVTVSGSTVAIFFSMMEVSGLSSASPLDQTGTAVGSGSTISVSTSGPVSQSDEYTVVFAYDWTATATFTAGTGYKSRAFSTSNGGGTAILGDGDKTSGLFGIQTATFTKTLPADVWSAIILTYK